MYPFMTSAQITLHFLHVTLTLHLVLNKGTFILVNVFSQTSACPSLKREKDKRCNNCEDY